VTRRLKLDIPGRDLRVAPDAVKARGWRALFAGDLPPGPLRMVVELGFGRGEFLIELARAAPSVAHVGVELSWKRVHKQTRRLASLPLRNIRLLHGRAEELLLLFEPGSLEALWINFPDPWPKKRHHRRRLVQAPLAAAIAARLAPGGLVHVATDDVAYAEQIDAVLAAEPGLENALAPARWLPEVPGRMETAYEREWRAQGRALHFWTYRRRAA
jgi:tRNA (guanine-N7-)-methyltransferase